MSSRLLIIIIFVAAAYFAYQQPESIPHPGIRDQVLGLKSSHHITLPDSLNISQATSSGIVQSATRIWQQVSQTKVPSNLSGMPEEVVVEDMVKDLSSQVKDLPGEQVKKIKTQFCQDVIQDSVASMSAEEHAN